MAGIVEYIVKEGDRWDSIAFKAYGVATDYARIIEANPNAVISPVLQPGQRIIIPVQEQTEVEIDSEDLPPWKR